MSNSKENLPDGRNAPPKGSMELGAPDTARTPFDGGAKAKAVRKVVVPLQERCWISVDEASQVAGEGRTKLYALIALNKLLTKKVGRRRLVNVRSLLEYCGE